MPLPKVREGERGGREEGREDRVLERGRRNAPIWKGKESENRRTA